MAAQYVSESVKTIQEEEIQVLEAVYDQDFEDLRKKDVWKVWRPPEFAIRLYPSKEGLSADAQVYVHLRMHVKLTETYPIQSAPVIDFEDEKGLSKTDVKALKQRVDEMARSLIGQAMICDLCQYIQEYLHEKNHPPDYQSFYEGMLKNQRRREIVEEDMRRKLQEQQRERELKEMEAIETELRKRQEQRKQERRINKAKQEKDADDDDSSEPSSLDQTASSVVGANRNRSISLPPPSVLSTVSPIEKNQRRLETVRDETSPRKASFKLITGSRLKVMVRGENCEILVGSQLGSTHQCHIDFVGVMEDSGQSVIISEWCLKLKRNNAGKLLALSTLDETAAVFHKELLALEQEYRGLVKLEHPNLIKYLSLCIPDLRQSPPLDIFRFIYIKEHPYGPHCVPVCQLVRRGISLNREYLRNLAKDTLSALDYLHSRAVLHKDLNENCIWDSGGGGFLLSDYSLRRRIVDLIEAHKANLFDIADNDGDCRRIERDRLMIGMGKTSRKSEVFTLGVCLLKLAIGETAFMKLDGGQCVVTRFLEDESIFSINDPLKDFIEKMVARDEERRWNCAKLLSHPFLIAGPTTANGKGDRLCGRHESLDSSDDEKNDQSAVLKSSYPALGGSARLETEFEVLKLLGRGGFGDVMKVKNKLDDCVYAIKRVVLNPKSKELNKKIIREVKLLSRLNHENVVRYYNSWIEQRMVERAVSETSTSDATPPSVVEVKPARKAISSSRKTVQPTRGGRPGTNKTTTAVARAEAKAKMVKKGGLGFDEDDVEDLAPPPALTDDETEWSVSFRAVDVESSSDEEDVFGNLFYSKVESNLLDEVNEGVDDVEDLVIFENAADPSAKPKLTAIQKLESVEEEEKSTLDPNWARQPHRQESVSEMVQILYIQMEFCQKNTLRQAIDYGELMEDRKCAWRLFREILEGLSYIHQQGMIHRDLKPVNIFLDSHDHVKIGDFGLATKLLATISGQDSAMATLEDISQSGGGDWANLSNEIQSELTTKIGTALYVSPELCPSPKPATSTPTGSSRIAYTQKVDMYSLGIVFFEMFYRPFNTAMERIKTLTDLRRPDVVLPADFVCHPTNEKPVGILRLLLQHDSDNRPTADDLLLSELLPPVEMQPSEFQVTVKQTLSNTQTHQYRWLVNVLLDEQYPSTVQEYVYDADMYDLGQHSTADALLRQWVEERLVELFRLYGAVRIDAPLLLPKSKVLTEHSDARVDMMDRSGCVLHLPYDLRVPFARYAVRSQIVHLKRYSISKVFRDEKRSSHPRQLTECAFDVITNPSGCTLATAEIIALASDVVVEFPALRNQNFNIKLNHTSILKAILLYGGVNDVSNLSTILELLSIDLDGRSGSEKAYMGKRQEKREKLRSDFGLNDKNISQILSLLQLEGTLTKISSILRCITKRKDSLASSLAKEGLHELETIKHNAETLGKRSRFGGTLPIVVSLNLIYNLHEYDGPVFQLVGEVSRPMEKAGPNKKASALRTFGAGGRYDQLLNYFRKPARLVKPSSSCAGALVFTGGSAPVQGAVGISFAFDLIVQLMASEANRRTLGRPTLNTTGSNSGENSGQCLSPSLKIGLSPYDILICSVGHKLMLKEKLALVRDFRLARLRADYLQDPVQNLEDLQDFCLRTGVRYLIVIKEGDASSMSPLARVRYWDKAQDRAVDKRLQLAEVVGFVQDKYQEEGMYSREDSTGHVSLGHVASSQFEGAGEAVAAGVVSGSGMTSITNTAATPNNLSNLKIHFAVLDRPPYHIRKRHETQIGKVLGPVLQKFSTKETIELIATDLPGIVVKQLAAVGEFNRDEENSFRASAADVASRFNKFKKEFRLVVDSICELKFVHGEERQEQQTSRQGQSGAGRNGVVVLYSYADDCYRFLL